MTLYDVIMGCFTKTDWSKLGRGEIDSEETIRRMLAEGYEAVADEQ